MKALHLIVTMGVDFEGRSKLLGGELIHPYDLGRGFQKVRVEYPQK